VRECPIGTANIIYEDKAGAIKVRVDAGQCIACGRCVSVCKHNARVYTDDTERFFEDLDRGVAISLISAPAVRTNIPDWKRLFTYLKERGVKKIYDVSLGVDICIWAHVRHMQANPSAHIITQPCPAIVSYCQLFKHELLTCLSPVHSPMGCAAVYMREYEGISDKIAALSPCIAKSHEFEAVGFPHYNVTFAQLRAYLDKHAIALPDKETGFDHPAAGLGTLFPMPGGLKENMEHYFGKAKSILASEGEFAYENLERYVQLPKELRPEIFDVLNCAEGCNMGTACSHESNIFEADAVMRSQRQLAAKSFGKENLEAAYRAFDARLDRSRFLRRYSPLYSSAGEVTDADIKAAFLELGKVTKEQQNIDCGACGNEHCAEMAKQVAQKVNIPSNCIFRTMGIAKKEHEENLDMLEQFETVWESVENGIAIIDAETRVILNVNPAAARMFEASKEDLIGKPCQKVLCPAQRCPILELNQVVDRSERRLIKKDKSSVPIIKSVSKIHYKGREALLESFSDISHFRKMEEKQRLLEVVEQANKSKSSFLAGISHEIRTPMNAILGITEIQLQDGTLSNYAKDAFTKILNSGYLLLGIINNLLDMSKIEAGKMETLCAEYSVSSLISDTVQLNISRIGSKPIEFKLSVDERLPANLIGDVLHIKQILNNILSNAFKYTAAGSVCLSVESEPSTKKGEITVVFRVSDTGQGMTQEQLGRIFEQYTRFNPEANRMTEGTGLGMNIAQSLTALMRGTLNVESEVDNGSIFTVRLPQNIAPGTEIIGKELAENLSKFRFSTSQTKAVQIVRDPMPYGSVLVVDDVETNIYVAKGFLIPYGLSIDSCESGIEAIEKIKSGKSYDLIFMDHMMPGMDGIEAVGIIRQTGYHKPIVALTANAVVGQAEVFLSNGFDDYISKPIDIRRLNSLLNKYVRDRYAPEVVEAARSAQKARVEKDDPGVSLNPQLAQIFIRDAHKAIAVLEKIYQIGFSCGEEDIKLYVISVHAMKSALANIGEKELSTAAAKLEKAGRDNDMPMMTASTHIFIDALKEIIKKITPKKEAGGPKVLSEEEKQNLCERIEVIKAACLNFDRKTAKEALGELKQALWPEDIKDAIEQLSQALLHSDFDEAEAVCGRITNN